MAGERRRSARARRSPRDDDSDDPEMSAALQLTRLDGGAPEQSRESDRLAKIQEKNRKAQQKFRERRKEKMLSMEREIQDLHLTVRQLQADNESLQEQLAIEKRASTEKSAKLDQKPGSLTTPGLHDHDPIDMSFLPQWEGLSLSNEKIRTMPSDMIKVMIQTILQDLRLMLSSAEASVSPSFGNTVTQAFAFLNRCYLVEPVRYRKIVLDMMGPSGSVGPATPPNAKSHIPLSRDQEVAISQEVELFEKRCEEIFKARETACDAIKQQRVCRGSESENMKAFVQVHAQLEKLQETLTFENEVLVQFLINVGRILGPLPLTHAIFSGGGQDIFTYCKAVHCRAFMVNGASLSSQSQGLQGAAKNSQAEPSGSISGLTTGGGGSVSWPGRDKVGSAAITGSIHLVDNLMMSRMNDSAAMDLDQQMRERSTNVLSDSRRLDAPVADGPAMHSGLHSSPAPQHQSITFDSPFLYPGPGDQTQALAGGGADGSQAGACQGDFRIPKSEPGVAGPQMNSGSDFMNIFRSVGDGQRQDSVSVGFRSLLKEGPGSVSIGVHNESSRFPFASLEHPGVSGGVLTGQDTQQLPPVGANILAGSLANLGGHNGNTFKGLLSVLQQGQGEHLTSAAGPNPAARASNLTELEALLQSKEGSRTLETLAQDLITARTLSAAELMNIHPEELSQVAVAQAATSSQPTDTTGIGQMPMAQVMSGMPRPQGAGIVSTGHAE